MSPRAFSDRELRVIRQIWLSSMRDVDLAERLGRSRGTVRRKAVAIGLSRRRRARARA